MKKIIFNFNETLEIDEFGDIKENIFKKYKIPIERQYIYELDNKTYLFLFGNEIVGDEIHDNLETLPYISNLNSIYAKNKKEKQYVNDINFNIIKEYLFKNKEIDIMKVLDEEFADKIADDIVNYINDLYDL